MSQSYSTKTVVYNLNNIRPPITGIGRYAIELLRGRLKAQLGVTVAYKSNLYTLNTLPSLLEYFEQTGDPSSQVNWRHLAGSLPFSRDIYRQFNNWKFDRLLDTEARSQTIFHDLNYSKNTTPLTSISTVYDLSFKYYADTHPRHRVRFLERYMRQLVKGGQPIITISNSVKSELMTEYGIVEDQISVTPLAAGSEFQPKSQLECEPYLKKYGLKFKQFILCVGTLEPRKNLDRLLTAYCSLSPCMQKEFPLVIAGPQGWKSRELETRISQLQTLGLLIKIGFVPQEQLPLLYTGAAVFAYPSLYEGFGLPLLEAMQCGCPTITSNTGAMAEVVNDCAVQVNPLSSDDIASSLVTLLEDNHLREHYSNKGKQRASHFSWAKTVEQTHKIYNSLG